MPQLFDISKLFQFITESSVSAEKFTPYRPALNWSEYENVHKSNPVISKLVKMRKANVGANGWDIHCNLFNQESRNEKLARKTYKHLEDNLQLNRMIAEIVTITSIFGNSYGVQNSSNLPIIQRPKLFNLYYDTLNKESTKIKLLIDGKETDKTFYEGDDIYIFRDPDTLFKPLADSPIDSCYEWYLLYQHAVQVNNNMISRGNIGTVIAMFEKEMQQTLDQVVDPKMGKKFWEVWTDQFKQLFAGSKNSNKIGVAVGVKEFLDLAKSNKDIQLVDLIERAEQAMYQSFGFTKTGENSTYNNAKTFSYEQWDNVGRAYEQQIEHYVNTFLLPWYGVETSEDFYFAFNAPDDPDEVTHKTMYISMFDSLINVSGKPEYKAKITNILLDKMGLETIDEKLLEEEPQPQLETVQQSEPKALPQKQPEQFASSKKKLTPTEKALKSTDYYNPRTGTGFLKQWEKAIKKQLETFVKKIEDKETVQDAIDTEFPKVETYYSITALKKDLLKFVDQVLDSEKFAESYSEYPEDILQFVDERAESLLKGDSQGFAGVDEETSSRIMTILRNNMDKGVAVAIEALREKIADISLNRATMIAETEVNSAVEGTRFIQYSNAGYTHKRVLNVGDSKVSKYCIAADKLGVVKIDYEYDTAFGKSKSLPFHPHERSTMIYGMSEEELQ